MIKEVNYTDRTLSASSQKKIADLEDQLAKQVTQGSRKTAKLESENSDMNRRLEALKRKLEASEAEKNKLRLAQASSQKDAEAADEKVKADLVKADKLLEAERENIQDLSQTIAELRKEIAQEKQNSEKLGETLDAKSAMIADLQVLWPLFCLEPSLVTNMRLLVGGKAQVAKRFGRHA